MLEAKEFEGDELHCTFNSPLLLGVVFCGEGEVRDGLGIFTGLAFVLVLIECEGDEVDVNWDGSKSLIGLPFLLEASDLESQSKCKPCSEVLLMNELFTAEEDLSCVTLGKKSLPASEGYIISTGPEHFQAPSVKQQTTRANFS